MGLIEFIVFLVCLSGCSYQAFRSGVNEGTYRCVDRLHQEKIISFDNKGNIVPNPFFNS